MKSVVTCQKVIRISGLLLVFAVAGCTGGSQMQFDTEHTDITLSAEDLKAGGIGFLTPAAATKLEADKQALAQSFSKKLQEMRPDIEVISLPELLGAVNAADLDQQYKQMYRDYRQTSILDGAILQQVGAVSNVRYLAQLSLGGFMKDSTNRFGFMVRMVETKQANIRVFIQIWDSYTTTVAWEGGIEMNYAYDTSKEMPVTFHDVAQLAAEELFARLPSDDSSQKAVQLAAKQPVSPSPGAKTPH